MLYLSQDSHHARAVCFQTNEVVASALSFLLYFTIIIKDMLTEDTPLKVSTFIELTNRSL